MTLPNAVPKPKSKPKRVRVSLKHGKPLKRGKRIKQRNARRKGSSFPEQRDAAHCIWVATETPCVGLQRFLTRRISPNDWPTVTWFVHVCWGEHDPAHVGKHRAQGAPDLGHVVNMCRALHDFYDQHRSEFAKATGLTERKLALLASDNALKYVEQGGAAPSPEPKEPN